jgi:hypothetical protein
MVLGPVAVEPALGVGPPASAALLLVGGGASSGEVSSSIHSLSFTWSYTFSAIVDSMPGLPPLEALKILIGQAASHKDADMHIMLLDVKRAYFHAATARDLYVEIPREDPASTPDAIGRLNLALYGTKDAAKLWRECVAEHLVSIGFRRGRSNPCVYDNKAKDLRTLVHGDDYATVGSYEEVKWLQKELESAFEMKTVISGHSSKPGVVTEAKILNRVIRAVPAGWEYDFDQRHAEIILGELDLKKCKPVGSPGVEETLKRSSGDEAHGAIPLSPAMATQYRGLTARANYMAQDRAEIQYAVKELCRTMSAPNNDSWSKLQRLAKYLAGRPRAVSLSS